MTTHSNQKVIKGYIISNRYHLLLFRAGLDSHILRFVGQMDTVYSVDKSRKFIISYFLVDDTISVFEPPQRNSGVLGGKFLERGRCVLPGQNKFDGSNPSHYDSTFFSIGAKLLLNKTPFIIIGADDYGNFSIYVLLKRDYRKILTLKI